MSLGLTTETELSLGRAAGWYAECFGIPSSAPRGSGNLKRLVRDLLERWLADGADWIHTTGEPGSAARRYRFTAAAFDAALDQLPRCCGASCDRPALREDGACGSCGYGRTGRPREVEWKLRTCAGCGRQEMAPVYGRQKRWWCANCNGRQKYEPHECEREGCHELVSGGDRFCGKKCSALREWREGILNRETIAPGIEALKQHRAERAEIKSAPGVIPLPEVGPRLHFSKWAGYGWREQGKLEVVEHDGGRLLTTTEPAVSKLKHTLAVENSPRLFDPDTVERHDLDREASRLGGDREAAKLILRERVRRRRAVVLRYMGRPAALGPAPHHLEWFETFLELRGYYDRRACAGDETRSDWRLYQEVAELDFSQHPERWSVSPAMASEAAGKRVGKAIKALQIAGT